MTNKLFNLIKKITPSRWHWVLNHEGHKRYFANMSWMFGGQMFSLLISFFIGAWIARYLGPENYGVLSYSVAFVGLFGFISSLGIDNILNRELIQTKDKRDELLGTAFRLKLIGGVIAFSLAFISVLIFQSSPLVQLLVVLFSFTFILQSINVINIYFNAEVKSKNNVRATIVATIISSILKIIVILLGEGVIWLIVIYVLDSLWQGIGLIKAYKNYGLKIKSWKFDNILAKEMLKNSWPLMLASAVGFVSFKIDQVIIGSMLGNYKVGIYAVATKLVEVWYFIPGIICASLFPAIINAKKTSVEMYKNRLKNFYILMAVIPIAMAIPITLLAKPIILILFGSGYLESVVILQIYIWSSVGLFLGSVISQYLISENLVKTIFGLNLLTMIINVLLNLILIPIFGIVGSAWATFISYLIIPIGVMVYEKFLRKI
ncbi:MAG: flippase [Candidatus Paceibacterota bacterium]|jgi:O-antigen/teichoic acid export membrane protein